jgi:hypothetical protein
MNNLNQPTKQKRTSDQNRLLPAVICTATAFKAALGRLVLFTLLMLSLTTFATAAFAQSAGDTGKDGAGSTPTPDVGASPAGSRGVGSVPGYLQRFPYAAAAYQADTLSKNSNGVMASNPGSPQMQMAMQFLMVPDAAGMGIAYFQPPAIAVDTPAAARDSELFQNLMTTFGYPMSDSQFQIIQRENNQRLLELAFDPERVMWMTSATSQTTNSQVSKSMANTGELALNAVFNYIVNGDGNGSLINVANEGSVAGLTYRGNGDDIGVAQAVSMVQTMYKLVFIPMAVLFLLPGAVISQVKSITAKGFGMQATESQSPFDGILRSIVAVFLIPATQVIVSWSIDTGNSLAYSCKQWVDLPTIMNWTQQLCYGPQQSVNAMIPPNPGGSSSSSGGSSVLGSIGSSVGGSLFGSLGADIGGFLGGLLGGALGGYGGVGDGLAANQPDTQAVIEQQDWMGQALQSTLNGAMLMAAITLIVMTALQVVTMCYLLLLGPISAAFYAWPQVSSTHLFRGVFGKWVDGVIKISMWRFVWMTILAIMTQRIIYMGGMPADLKWEAAVFICFLGLMVGVPAAPFTFQPFSAFQSAKQLQSQSQTQQMGMGPQGGQQSQGNAGGSTMPAANQGGGGTANAGGSQGGGAGGAQTPTTHDGGTSTPTTAGGTGNDTKDGNHGTPTPPPQTDQTHGAAGTPSGTPQSPQSGSGTGTTPPPGVSGNQGGLPNGGGNQGGGNQGGGNQGGGNQGGGNQGGGNQGGGSTNVNVQASTPPMPTNGPATPMTPPGGATPSNPAVSANPGTPPPPAAASPAGGGDQGITGSGDKGSTKSTSHGGGAAGGVPDASSAVGQIAGAVGNVQPPPPSKDDKGGG